MSIKLGDTTIEKIYLGSTEIEKIYQGDTAIYEGDEPTPPTPSYDTQYLTFVALEDGTTFTFDGATVNDVLNKASYSIDNGGTWTEIASGESTSSIDSGGRILWKGEMTPIQSNGIGKFTSTKTFDVEGNAMSLLFGDDFIGEVDLSGKDNALQGLFRENTNMLNAENLSLPATTLAANCYQYMFGGCTNLTTTPELPATSLETQCYGGMFQGCTSLTTAPELPATTLANYCYNSMFAQCTSLTTAPTVLPATTMASYCYRWMFNGCTSLTTAPELSATTLESQCCYGMFQGCTSLTTASELPATTLASSCYYAMFSGCTSLTTAPQLPATTLTTSCYRNMFASCTSLNSVTCLATDMSASRCTSNWLNGVAANGTFTKKAGAVWESGINGIPNGWTVVEV